jgi:L-amino acid N-acyltransferase YncA
VEQKRVKLKDGSEVLIRPMASDDLDRSFAFFQTLAKEDRIYLRVDITKRHMVERRIRDMEAGEVRRIVAVVDDKIVADGALELESHGWKADMAELRLIVTHEHQNKGLGQILANELYNMAVAEGVREIVVRVMRPQREALSILRQIGFRNETVLPDYVKDRDGKLQDLVLMRCRLTDSG